MFSCFTYQYFAASYFLKKDVTAQKTKFSINDFFSFQRIWSHLLKKSLMKTSFFMQCVPPEHTLFFYKSHKKRIFFSNFCFI